MVIHHYYTIGLKQWLGKAGFRDYNANPWIRFSATFVTFIFVATSLFFFANSMEEIQRIFSVMI
jgi:hypothetical protein